MALQVLSGDVSEPGLNLNDCDRETIVDTVTVILHSAATTKFNEHIKLALSINVMGVQHLIALAKQCRNLVSLVHVSTAYVNFPLKGKHVKERIYVKR